MANRKDDIRARLLATFRVEADEHLAAITANLLALERGLSPAEAREAAEATFRAVHTLKGAARSVSLREVEGLCQTLESLLSRVTRGDVAITPELLERLRQGVDGVARRLQGSGGEGAAAPARAAPETPGAPAAAVEPAERGLAQALPAPDTIRLSAARLDALLLQAEDLLAPKLAAEERVREARLLVEALGGAVENPEGLRARARELLAHLVRDGRAVSGVVDGLLEELRRLRMMPASTVLDVFPRMVRDLSREHGKEAEWVAHGGDLEVDRKVLEAVKDPLIHLVRNAVDHGIEPPEARRQAGKPPRGRVGATIAPLEGNRVEIRVEDDGAGIALQRVREAAVRSRLLTAEEARAATDAEVLELLYRSGLSTSPIITQVSGHGLGLAIVKERVERLGGRIAIETRAGAGTTVRMVLPASIATFRGLLVRSGGRLFFLPLESVERTLRVAPGEIESVEGRAAIRANGRPLPVAWLAALLGLPRGESDPAARQPCVIVGAGEERAGLLVEEILGDREVLVKELRPPLARVRNVSAAGLLGTGEIGLVLRAGDLLRAVGESPRPAAPVAARPERERPAAVLVVDDSITTRTMEKNLLEAAGYRVEVAVDGVEAWTLLRSEEFDLVVSDVDMPRMDGFELTARIRGDRKLGELPVVLVTALESREDRERGIEVGANAYVVKSSFDQSNLLEIIHRLV